MERAANCFACLAPSREVSEDLCEQFMKSALDAKVLNNHIILCVLALVGKYGVTKEEVSATTTSSFSYDKKTKPRPAIRSWCTTALQQVRLPFFAMTLIVLF